MRAERGNGQGAKPRPRALRRLTGRRDSLPRTIETVAAEADRPVDDVLREVADFRLALETDMIIAAAAVDADSPDLLSDVLDGERRELATFHDRLLDRLADAAASDELATRRVRKQQPRLGWASTLVAAAAAAIAVLGAGRAIVDQPNDVRAANIAALETADQHYADFTSAVNSDSPGAVAQAATTLHDTLERLINEHAGDPEIARRTAQMLQAEISLLQISDPDGASGAIARARTLVRLLQRAAPPQVRASVQPVLDAAVAPRPKSSPKATASPTATSTPSATASASASSTKESSSKDDEDNPLDNAP